MTFNKSYFIGFDHVDRLLDLANNTTKNKYFPPYNIKQLEENKYLIELAVAGYGKHDIEIEYANGDLTVKSSGTPDEDTSNYIWQGIAKRSFSHKFTLADTVFVKSASLTNGMLKVFLENIIPDEKKPKKVPISDEDAYKDHIESIL